jgi:hypothetical protein
VQTATKQLRASVAAAIVGLLCCVVPLVFPTPGDFGRFRQETATVTFDPDKATSAKLTQATTDSGFPSKVISKP